MQTKQKPDVVRIDFAATMAEINRGRSLVELAEKLQELTEAVRMTGKGGQLTYTIKVKPATRGQDVEQVTVSDEVRLKKPEMGRGETLFFATEKNELVRDNPRQGNLPGVGGAT